MQAPLQNIGLSLAVAERLPTIAKNRVTPTVHYNEHPVPQLLRSPRTATQIGWYSTLHRVRIALARDRLAFVGHRLAPGRELIAVVRRRLAHVRGRLAIVGASIAIVRDRLAVARERLATNRLSLAMFRWQLAFVRRRLTKAWLRLACVGLQLTFVSFPSL